MPTHIVPSLRRIPSWIAALGIVLSMPMSLPGQSRSQAFLVRRVIDGDTIEIATLGRVSLLGIDAPELARNPELSTPIARQAQQRLSGLLLNRWVRLEYEADRPTRSARSAYVFTEDGRFVNEWLVAEGLARVVPRRGLSRMALLAQAEKEARSSRRGIWSNQPPTR